MYTAAVLDDLSAGLLRWAAKAAGIEHTFGFDAGSTKLPHHMTINLGLIDEELNSREVILRPARLFVDKIYWCHKLGVCAAPVIKAEVEMQEFPAKYWESLYCMNQHPHITVAVQPHVKPKTSNDLLAAVEDGELVSCQRFDQTYILNAKVMEVK